MSHQLAPPGPPVDHRHVVQAERQQHGLFQPLIDLPGLGPFRALDLLGDAQLAGVQEAQRALDRVANVALRRGIDVRPVVEGGGDEALETGVRHEILKLREGPRDVRQGAGGVNGALLHGDD